MGLKVVTHRCPSPQSSCKLFFFFNEARTQVAVGSLSTSSGSCWAPGGALLDGARLGVGLLPSLTPV